MHDYRLIFESTKELVVLLSDIRKQAGTVSLSVAKIYFVTQLGLLTVQIFTSLINSVLIVTVIVVLWYLRGFYNGTHCLTVDLAEIFVHVLLNIFSI
jgi:hypothetical protein